MLPLWVFLAAYILVGFICLFFAGYGEDEEEEEQPIDQTNLLRAYQFTAILFCLIFVDSLLRWREGRRDSKWFWLCSGKLEILVLFGVLSLVTQFLYWSGIVARVNEQRPGG
jgi:hypothetical protein